MERAADGDPAETGEWLEALEGVIEVEGQDRAAFILDELLVRARRGGTPVPFSANTAYLNTIPPDRQARDPGDRAIEHKIRSYIRWNAVAIMLRANKESSELGGHVASFRSSALRYGTGFMHFWHAPHYVPVGARDDLVHQLDDRHLGSERVVDGRHLEPDDAAADDEQPLGDRCELQRARRVDDARVGSHPRSADRQR